MRGVAHPVSAGGRLILAVQHLFAVRHGNPAEGEDCRRAERNNDRKAQNDGQPFPVPCLIFQFYLNLLQKRTLHLFCSFNNLFHYNVYNMYTIDSVSNGRLRSRRTARHGAAVFQ